MRIVCFHETHEPVASPPDLVAQYPERGEREPGDLFRERDERGPRGRIGSSTTLDDMGEADRTFVIFTSDNGPETLKRYPNGVHCYGSPGPLRGMKLHIYDGGIRVPCIIRWPGHTKPGTVIDEPAWSADLLPTFCQIAGTRAGPAIAQSTVLTCSRCLTVGDRAARTPMFWFYYARSASPRRRCASGDWKLVAHWDVNETIRASRPSDQSVERGRADRFRAV